MDFQVEINNFNQMYGTIQIMLNEQHGKKFELNGYTYSYIYTALKYEPDKKKKKKTINIMNQHVGSKKCDRI